MSLQAPFAGLEELEVRLLLSNYYISTTGSDAHAGTLSAPFASLAHLLNVAKPGDNAYIEGGTYNGSSSGWSDLEPTISGTASAPITIQNYNGQQVVINTNQVGSNTTFVYLMNSNSYLTFQGLTLVNFKCGFNLQGGATAPSFITLSNLNLSYDGLWGSTSVDGAGGIRMFGGTHDVTIENCVIDHCSDAGLSGLGDVSDILIENCDSHDNNDGDGTGGSADGFNFTWNTVNGVVQYASNIVFLNDRAWNCTDDGIDVKGDKITYENCKVWNIGACCYKAWSISDGAEGVQGHFLVEDCLGYDAGETVFKALHQPDVQLINCTFINSDNSTLGDEGVVGESTLWYTPAYSYDPWSGSLAASNCVFEYIGNTSYAYAASVSVQNLSYLDMDYDTYYNLQLPNQAFSLTTSSSSTSYSNTAIANGSFYAATGLEQHGTAAPVDVAPFILSSSVPSDINEGTAQAYSAAAMDPEDRTLTYTWSFGDGTSPSVGSSVTHSYQHFGTYPAVLTVDDGQGGQYSMAFTVKVEPVAPGAADIDAIYAHFGSGGAYDLTGDGLVNQADVDYMVKTILHTSYGDANLDGAVDFLDFQTLLNNWQAQGCGWAGCDFNGDGVVDFLDFQTLLNNWNPAGSGASNESSMAANSSEATKEAAVSGGVSQTTAVSMAASAVPAINGLLSPDSLIQVEATLTPALSNVALPSVQRANQIATSTTPGAWAYVPMAQAAVLSRQSSLTDVLWTSADNHVDLLTLLIKPVVA
jgi:hypothetical protein